MKCDNCGKYKAVAKDYRSYNGISFDLISCKYCLMLEDVSHYRVSKEKLNPKKVLQEG